MIGKKLSEKGTLAPLPEEQAVRVLNEVLATHAKLLVEVRAQNMVACVVVRADKTALRLCRALGFKVTLGATAVFGLSGADAAQIFDQLPAHKRRWLEEPMAPRETKVLLIAGGTALLSIETEGGKVTITPG
jgi:hypothetical protein